MREQAGNAIAEPARLLAALAAIEPVPQALVLAHLTGDDRLLTQVSGHVAGGWSFEQDVPPALAQEVSQALVTALSGIAEGSLMPPSTLDPERFAEIMSAGINAPLPPDYAAMMLEELNLTGGDQRSVDFSDIAADARAGHDVAIIGAGLSGLALGAKLLEAGIPFVIYEKNHEVGGTWFENRYVGAAVDIPSHFYSYAFHRKPDWSHHFAKRDEIFGYLRAFAEDHGLLDHIRFGTSVEAADYDAEAGQWTLRLRQDGGAQEVTHRIVASAVGQLNRPNVPDFPGLDSFEGPAFHTAQWPEAVDLDGKRVALVGTGASAIQVGPGIADKVAALTVFQRSPNWAAPNPNYFRTFSEDEHFVLANVPYLIHWYRFLLFWASGDTLHASLQKDPDWPHPDRSLNADNEKMRVRLEAHIRAELDGDEALIAKATPSYPPYGKRMLRDNRWYRMLRRDNVELVDRGLKAVDRTGVIDEAGEHHACDAIIFSTGFKAAEMLAPMEVTGEGGAQLREVWQGDDARAYLGLTVPGFPNFFIMYGPNTNLAHGGSLFFHAECQVRHVMMLLHEMKARGAATVSVRPETFDAYNQRVDAAHDNMVWTHGGMRNWYRNSKGRVVTNSPWRLVDYWKMTGEMDPRHYIWR
ncbi:hypothetical protein ATO3_24470 [Marinibacterium profundimaris]|uniref:Monooxygenase n=1 Tax=Marinibacterium profundimaris TaxID=1679460 RepID=A0A225NBY6_9RHOB|nr:hypothetical protein ATO3_24470 [Marinibacterium profundimaris]